MSYRKEDIRRFYQMPLVLDAFIIVSVVNALVGLIEYDLITFGFYSVMVIWFDYQTRKELGFYLYRNFIPHWMIPHI